MRLSFNNLKQKFNLRVTVIGGVLVLTTSIGTCQFAPSLLTPAAEPVEEVAEPVEEVAEPVEEAAEPVEEAPADE